MVNEQWIERLNAVSREVCGSDFVIDSENRHTVEQCLMWLARDPKYGGDLSKGIQLRGTPGSGKTHLMRCMSRLCPPGRGFIVKPCQDVADTYAAKGRNGLTHLLDGWMVCFDDLGDEDEAKHYGNTRDVMMRVIEYRYNRMGTVPTVTHFTTNLNKEQLRQRYGERCYDRLMHMVDPLVLNREASFRQTAPVKGWDWNTKLPNR